MRILDHISAIISKITEVGTVCRTTVATVPFSWHILWLHVTRVSSSSQLLAVESDSTDWSRSEPSKVRMQLLLNVESNVWHDMVVVHGVVPLHVVPVVQSLGRLHGVLIVLAAGAELQFVFFMVVADRLLVNLAFLGKVIFLNIGRSWNIKGWHDGTIEVSHLVVSPARRAVSAVGLGLP